MIDPSSVSPRSAELKFNGRLQHWVVAARIAMGLVIAVLVALVLAAAEIYVSAGTTLSEIEVAAGMHTSERPTSR